MTMLIITPQCMYVHSRYSNRYMYTCTLNSTHCACFSLISVAALRLCEYIHNTIIHMHDPPQKQTEYMYMYYMYMKILLCIAHVSHCQRTKTQVWV